MSSTYNQALELATRYGTFARLVGRKRELYGQGKANQLTGMQIRKNFG